MKCPLLNLLALFAKNYFYFRSGKELTFEISPADNQLQYLLTRSVLRRFNLKIHSNLKEVLKKA